MGNNEPVSIVDEVPFEIPESWEWVRFKDLVNYSMGKTPPRKEDIYWSNPEYKWVSISDMKDGETIYDTKEMVNQYALENTFRGNISPAGSLLMSFKLTVGKVSILGMDAFHNEAIISIYPYVDDNRTMTKYLFEVLPLLSQEGDTKTAIKGKTLNSSSLDALFIPVPPLSEQERIVQKLDQLKSPIQQYAASEDKANDLYVSFPDKLRKSILQEAVMGKLVPQDENDKPASVLLDRIREEKQRLISEGKLKKEKHESIIYRRDNSHYEKIGNLETCIDDEIPFEIPDSWEWVRFYNIVSFENGDRSKKYPVESDYVTEGIPFFGAKDMSDKYMSYNDVRFISEAKFEELGNGKLQDGDMICLLRGSVGKTRIFKASSQYSTGFICAQMMIIRCINLGLLEYLYTVILSPYFTQLVESKITGTAVRQLPAKEVANLLIPVPPIEEQERIIQAINKINSHIYSL